MANHQTRSTRDRAIAFAEGVIMRSTDWQQVQHALADHPEFGPWLDAEFGDNAIGEAQAIIRAAEERRGEDLPTFYG